MQSSTDQHWSNLYDNGRDFTLISSGQITKFLSYAQPGAIRSALDIGCGTGQLTRELCHRGIKCVGVDASASAIEIAQSLTTVPSDNLTYLHFDFERDAADHLPHEPYDLVICKLVYAFIKDRGAFFERVSQLLAPGGLFVVITPLPEDVTPEKQSIAATPGAMQDLADHFEQAALYKALGLTYFIGKHKARA